MVTQKTLVARIAEITGEAIETVTVVDRFLAEAGLRTRAKRGRGLTLMTIRDVAHVLIAATAARVPTKAVDTVRRSSIAIERLVAALDAAKENARSSHPYTGDAFIWSEETGLTRKTYTVSGAAIAALAASL